MTPLALISDIHGNLPALDAVAADIAARHISRVVNLGDHVSGPLWPRETAARLMQYGWPSIAGNHDRMVVRDDPASLAPSDRFAFEQLTEEQFDWLAALPPTIDFADDGMLLCHGIPTDDRRYLLETPEHGRLRLASPEQVGQRLGETRAPLVLCGHSHVARVGQCADTVIVNPGSVGLPAYSHEGSHPHVSEAGSPLARYAVLEWLPHAAPASPPRITFVALAYDSEAAARRADVNGRDDWGYALRTGFAGRR